MQWKTLVKPFQTCSDLPKLLLKNKKTHKIFTLESLVPC